LYFLTTESTEDFFATNLTNYTKWKTLNAKSSTINLKPDARNNKFFLTSFENLNFYLFTFIFRFLFDTAVKR